MLNNSFTYPEEIRNLYKTSGAAPHLDGEYTVFGEITSGLEIIDKIASVATDKNDRPAKDIKFKIKIIEY